jgi:amidase
MKEIVFSSTTRLATAIRKRKITAQEALDAFLAQINKHNPALNAVNIIGADQAKERVHTADEALARGELWGPLHGVPFTLKDAHSTAGTRTTVGFPPCADKAYQRISKLAWLLTISANASVSLISKPVFR